ncbi:MAG: hypothetical protein M1835_003781 [Candelina submexicana]|nr:MAG: hypothetical protein M1835_003781 [Candelina submexicana]
MSLYTRIYEIVLFQVSSIFGVWYGPELEKGGLVIPSTIPHLLEVEPTSGPSSPTKGHTTNHLPMHAVTRLKPAEESCREIASLSSIVLDLPPSCVEFSPTAPNLVVVGTYYLEDESTAIVQDTNSASSSTISGFESTSGQQRSGSLILLELSEPDIIQYFTSETLVLALAFHPEIPDLIGVSLSSGEIALCQTQTQAKKALVVWKLPAHSLEAWTVIITETNFDEPGGDILYSGGDDSALCAHAVRSPKVIGEVQQIESRRYERAHGAGVTAIVPLPLYPILLTGSYDDHVRVFNPQDSKVLAEAKIGGGVWRLRMLSPYKRIRMEEEGTSFRVLASCMHAGARILKVSHSRRGAWGIEVVAKFEEHGSMNYGSDAQPPRREFLRDHAHVTCVSTSFYDKLLCLWRYDEHEVEDP